MGIRLCARYQWEDTDSPPFFDKTFVGPRITIGNDPAASLCLNGSVLSPEQIVIIDGETQPQLINQAEGTSLNGEMLALNAQRPLRDGDRLGIGTYRITIFLNSEASTSRDDPAARADRSIAQRNGGSTAQGGEPTLQEFLQAPESSLDSSIPTDELSETFLPAEPPPRASKSFAAILDSLRTDEDRFYFVVEGGDQAGIRIPIEHEEMPLGWDETNEGLCFNIAAIANLCAVVRKDWSGVILQPQAASGITVNNQPLEEERRLRDGDRLRLRASDKDAVSEAQVLLVFREPTSLVILDSLMPRVQPLTEGAGPSEESGEPGAGEHLVTQKPAQKLAALIKSDKEYFTVFTFVELSLMAIGTIVGAVIIFLILNYS